MKCAHLMADVGVTMQMLFFIFVLGAGFSIGGLMWVISAYRYIATAKRSESWIRVAGIITRSTSVLNDQSFLPTIEYSYELNGEIHTGSSIHAGAAFSSSEQWAKSVLARYPVGSTADVAVDPGNPTCSVLEPGTRWHMYMFLCAGALITTLGLWLLSMVATHWHREIVQQTTQERRAQEISRAS